MINRHKATISWPRFLLLLAIAAIGSYVTVSCAISVAGWITGR
jgi:hypothetical protein